jgi:AcrR family transcriptional regulator
METDAATVEARIVEAAIACIERYGIQGTTNRKIAQTAGVNSAAINYYFRSKDVLISRCMRVTLEKTFDWDLLVKLPEISSNEFCCAFFDEFIKNAIRLPGLTRALFFDALTSGNMTSPAVTVLNQFLSQLAQNLRTKGILLDDEELQLAISQIAAATLWIALVPCIFEQSFGLDMHDPDMRQVFVHRLVNKIL